jgi:hypothetical protein
MKAAISANGRAPPSRGLSGSRIVICNQRVVNGLTSWIESNVQDFSTA